MDCSSCIFASPNFTSIYCTKLQKFVIGQAPCLKEEKRTIMTNHTEYEIEEVLKE